MMMWRSESASEDGEKGRETVAERAVVEELVEEEDDVHVVQRAEALADLIDGGRLDDRRVLR